MVISVNEMTSIQALERIAPDLSLKQGEIQSIEFEYKRHGTQTILGGFNVATGHISGLIQQTRTENDFVKSIQFLIKNNPNAQVYHFISDQLNTHKLSQLVDFVANYC